MTKSNPYPSGLEKLGMAKLAASGLVAASAPAAMPSVESC